MGRSRRRRRDTKDVNKQKQQHRPTTQANTTSRQKFDSEWCSRFLSLLLPKEPALTWCYPLFVFKMNCWAVKLFAFSAIPFWMNMRLMLEESDSDLHRDFNLPNMIPVWKAVRGLNFSKLLDSCLPYLDHRSCEVIVCQMAGNNLYLASSISALTEKYLAYAHKFIRYCQAKTVIICEALPCTKTRYCSVDSYFDRWKRFNATMHQQLLIDKTKPDLNSTYFNDSQVWYWTHEKLQGASQLTYGVHLSRQGIRRYGLHGPSGGN